MGCHAQVAIEQGVEKALAAASRAFEPCEFQENALGEQMARGRIDEHVYTHHRHDDYHD